MGSHLPKTGNGNLCTGEKMQATGNLVFGYFASDLFGNNMHASRPNTAMERTASHQGMEDNRTKNEEDDEDHPSPLGYFCHLHVSSAPDAPDPPFNMDFYEREYEQFRWDVDVLIKETLNAGIRYLGIFSPLKLMEALFRKKQMGAHQ